MSPTLAVGVFVIVLSVLGLLIFWEHRRVRSPPGISPEKLQSQLTGPHISYTAPPEKRARSMERAGTA